jgi:hypothetical protein
LGELCIFIWSKVLEETLQHLLASAWRKISRLEVLEGPTDRRSWLDELRVQIVAESFEPVT